jgi:hypothetical protein
MVATPDALVSAVPLVGVIVAKVASVVKVTTAFGTGAPVASNTVAETVVGVAEETEVTDAPDELVRDIFKPDNVVVETVDPVVDPGEELEEDPVVLVVPLPPQLFNETIITVTNTPKITAEIFCLIERIIEFSFYSRHAQFSEPIHYNKSILNTIA